MLQIFVYTKRAPLFVEFPVDQVFAHIPFVVVMYAARTIIAQVSHASNVMDALVGWVKVDLFYSRKREPIA